MRKLKSIDKFLIAALVLFSIMFCSSAFGQGLGVIDDNPNIYGEWKSMDGEHTLYMNYLEEYDLDNFVRISVGIENIEDLISDIDYAIKKTGG